MLIIVKRLLMKLIKETGIKKFDICLMNPPYGMGLHLKFLEKVIEVTDKVVTIQPTTWLQDPKENTHKKKYRNTIINNILDLENINQIDAAKIFKARFSNDIGIYVCSKNHEDKNFDEDVFGNTVEGYNIKDILEKIKNKTKQYLGDVIEHQKVDGWRVRIDHMRPIPSFDPRSGKDYEVNLKGGYSYLGKNSYVFYDGKRNGKWWSECVGAKNQFTKKVGDPFPNSIKFDTEKEAENFENSLKTVFMQFIRRAYQRDTRMPLKNIPFMNDYKNTWDDNDFKNYYKFSDNEWNIIINVMKKYV